MEWNYEEEAAKKGWKRIAGVDEAGRGCLAGPVVAAAFIFLDRIACPAELNDSKKLSRAVRQKLFQHFTSHPSVDWSVGIATVEEIDRLNILRASHLAMKRALEGLNPVADFILVDGLRVHSLGKNQQPIVGGDSLSPSIAAASIIAKETRDRLMEELHEQFPQYNFAKHKGYGTALHMNSIQEHGICPLHRRSFAPVRQIPLPL